MSREGRPEFERRFESVHEQEVRQPGLTTMTEDPAPGAAYEAPWRPPEKRKPLGEPWSALEQWRARVQHLRAQDEEERNG